MADGDEASVTPPSPPRPQIGEQSFDISQIGHQNALMLQQMAGMIQNAMVQNRLENEQAMTQIRLDLEQMMNDKFAAEMIRRREHILTIREAELMPALKKPRFDNSFSWSFSSNQSYPRFQPGGQGSNAKFCRHCNRKHSGPCRNLSRSNNNNVRRSPNPSVRCYRCGEAGHFSNQCTQTGTICFGCGVSGHVVKDCPLTTPAGSQASVARPIESVVLPKKDEPARVRPRVFQITVEEAREATDVVSGISPLNNIPARVLFDSGAIHSFVTPFFGCHFGVACYAC